jgi:uncharacterized protein (TIGR04222 family)
MVEFGPVASLTSIPAEQTALHQRLQAFCFDRPDSPLSFSQRLARENHWSWEFAERAIVEYKRFAFLAVVAGHPVTPSDQVDQVWHLHLTYTRSYWEEFCPQVLQKPLHHEPTRGGVAESLKFEDWYGKTLESYQHWFGELPPEDIWPAAAIRFGTSSQFVRVNAAQSWVVPKPSLPVLPKPAPQLALFLPLMLILTGCGTIAGFPNPLDFNGSQFLSFYLLLIVIGLLLSLGLRTQLLPDESSPPAPSLDAYEVAYLAGGKSRAVDTAIFSLVQKKFVTVLPEEKKLKLEQSIESYWPEVDQAVAAVVAEEDSIGQIHLRASVEMESVGDRLQQLNLVLKPVQSFQIGLYPNLPILALLCLGIAKISVGVGREKPVGFLMLLCLGLVIFGLGLLVTQPSRTRYGDRRLDELHNQFQPLKKASTTDQQLLMCFALFGSVVLADDFTDLRGLLLSPSDRESGSSSSCSSSGCGSGSGCGGGGCGGGGCGGCGG